MCRLMPTFSHCGAGTKRAPTDKLAQPRVITLQLEHVPIPLLGAGSTGTATVADQISVSFSHIAWSNSSAAPVRSNRT